jgi:beta-phosphoglucomutase
MRESEMNQNFNSIVILVDFDGTLANTYEANFLAYVESCSLLNYDLSKADFSKYWGQDSFELLRNVFTEISPEEIAFIKKNKAQIYHKHFEKIKPNAALLKFLVLMKENFSAKLGLISNAKSNDLESCLEYLGITNLFDLVISGDDVKSPKPNPEGFLLAIDYFECEIENYVVFEDSNAGIESAIKAGLNPIRVAF